MGAKTLATSKRIYPVAGLVALVALVLALAAASAGKPAYADEIVNPEYTAALDRLNALTDEYNSLAAEQSETLGRLEDVRTKIDDNQKEMANVQKEIDARKVELAEKQKVLASYVADDYKTGGVSLLSILLSASSIEDAVSKVHYYGVICDRTATKIEDVNAARTKLQKDQDELKKLEGELQKQEADIDSLYQQQSAQADQMLAQQLEAAELVTSLPKEIQQTLGDDAEELVNESQAVINANELQNEQNTSATNSENNSQMTTNNSSSTKNNSSSSSNKNNSSSSSSSSSQPKTTVGASGTLQALIDMAYATGPTRKDWGCSGWVYIVFRDAGISSYSGSAAQFYSKWCYSSDRSQLRPGMIIAVNNTGGSEAGRRYGHIGIYLGNDTVRHYTGGKVQDFSVDKWIKWYGSVCTPRWGWNGGVVLS